MPPSAFTCSVVLCSLSVAYQSCYSVPPPTSPGRPSPQLWSVLRGTPLLVVVAALRLASSRGTKMVCAL
ncbi:hypothetical protein PR003_g26737 [Phytophthora rubi]|uniref:Uncharacterized protein n=1 Tax=Phytophthora rubi TaxID=129364 RepID=A0A6A4C4Z8_9STRA|nr:hypothetical protein PR002_g25694 [Phytophthora rubi]KAE8976256.1 hypothetical protein PR001_g25471 [Phytophthora rubi]KAE9284894.1 hypothetical protein PR003_g26737 [Phytophthora rubi]